jgi:hypothetical protein
MITKRACQKIIKINKKYGMETSIFKKPVSMLNWGSKNRLHHIEVASVNKYLRRLTDFFCLLYCLFRQNFTILFFWCFVNLWLCMLKIYRKLMSFKMNSEEYIICCLHPSGILVSQCRPTCDWNKITFIKTNPPQPCHGTLKRWRHFFKQKLLVYSILKWKFLY